MSDAEWTVAPGFGAVADAFRENLARRGERGAAFAAVRNGEVVVDVWGGAAAPGVPWRADTLQLLFSGTKGLVAACFARLLDHGLVDLDAPVARYWPEFAANGKAGITVGEVLSHRAGLPGVRRRLRERDLCDGARMARLLAAQPREWDPRAGAVYHPLTYGWLAGELIRRVTGRSAGRYLADEIAAPLGLDIWLGLPERHAGRVSELAYGPGWGTAAQLSVRAGESDRLLGAAWANPPLFPAPRMPWNDPDFRAAEIPGANAIGTARSLARLYGCLALGGRLDGVTVASAEALAGATAERSHFVDPLTGERLRYGAGFQLQTGGRRLGPPAHAFGHTGAGGSVSAAWPRERIGVAYVMNELRDEPGPDPRAVALLRAVHRAAAGQRSTA
ncbi:serine hydrolase domain-containing protein [Dactylosporangium sucinum]|uniref:Esterase n=1 Tax=Dactylosporangium sucinum TaxID=1424081 RepID=A0A917TSP0_9ACTN|nr:serine hydrolase domain-containing protein [Dactylosporangium sucinum]GGM36353.1 esterase [Dactylosporangium sucinum]